MHRKKVLLIGGSLNQTRMTHAVGVHLAERYDCYYSPAYVEGPLELARQMSWLDFTVLGNPIRQRAEDYLKRHNLPIDIGGQLHDYDLAVLTTDLIIPANLRGKPLVLVQEGMTDAETWQFRLVKALRLPRWLAGTATNGLSDAYQVFCVASPGYRQLFINKGCRPEKLVVTGLPNFDDVQAHLKNDFPHRDYVLVATSNARETFKRDDRQAFLRWALELAAGRPLIFKLHPAENAARAAREIQKVAPDALIFSDGSTDQMIANCSVLITQYSSCVYVGLALGKECHSYFDIAMLRQLTPVQNGGASGRNIAQVCARVLEQPASQPAGAAARPAAWRKASKPARRQANQT
jgi:hypothetical protein